MIHLNINCKKHHKILALFILLLSLGFSTAWAQTTYRFDYTYKVGTDPNSWHVTDLAGTNVAPAVSTANGLTVQMVEKYEGNSTTINDGTNDNGKLYQEVSGLPNGTYEVKLYANACRANIGTFDGNCNVQVYAGNVTQRVTPQNSNTVSPNGEYTLSNVSVTNGTLKIGLRKTSSGTNWYTIQIKSLTRISTNPDGFLRMKNVQSGGSNYYLGTSGNNDQSGNPYLCTKQDPGNDGIWYLETTGNGYHLIHVSDCKRVVTNRTDNGEHAVHLETTNTGSVYTVVTGGTNGMLICPQGSTSQSFNQWLGNGGDIGWYGTGSNGSFWTFENVTYSMEAPTITFDNSTNKVTISHTNSSANIYYTLDGYDPSDASTAYSNSFSQTTPVTVKAVAYGCIVHSSVAQLQIIKVATPTVADIQDNQITITTTTPGATIYYKTTEAGTYQQYTSPISATGISQIWAYAKKDNCINSDVANRILTTPTILAFTSNALTMTSTTLSLPSVSLTAEGNPISGTITYSSNNTGCVSVNNTGVLTINGAGTAIITAAYAGDATYSPSSATMTITVANTDALDETVLSDMTITPSSQTLDLGEQVTYTASESLNNIHRTCQAYTTITTNGNNYYKVGANYQAAKPTTNEDGTPVRFTRFNWSAEEGTAYFALDQYYSATSNQVTLTRSELKTASNHSYTITVTGVYGGQNKTATATVTIPATWVDLTALHAGEALNLGVGESGTLEGHYTWEPNYDEAGAAYKKFTYTSNNTNVATVGADGNVTAVGAGSTTITLQSIKMDGTVNTGVSCGITVNVSVAAPTISIDASGYVTITPPIAGLQIRYTRDGSNPTATTGNEYSGPFGPVSNETVVKAVTVSNDIASTVASKQYITTGISGSKVVFNDLEDHNMTLYQSMDNLPENYPLYLSSPNPKDVKITYNGGSVSNASAVGLSGLNDTEKAINTFVYYKTIEKKAWQNTEGQILTGDYAYKVIPNPFSKRPRTNGSTGTDGYFGFAGWKITNGRDYIRRENGDMAAENAVLGLEEKINFVNLPEYGAEIEFTATWTPATVVEDKTTDLNASGTYETNFIVYTDNNGHNLTALNDPATVSSYYPDGTPSGSARITAVSAPSKDTKIEFIGIGDASASTSASGTFTASGDALLFVGRGCTGYVQYLYGSGGKMRARIESGYYDYCHPMQGGTANANTNYAQIVFGNDYERATNDGLTSNDQYEDNSEHRKMRVKVFVGSNNAGSHANNNTDEFIDINIKSGYYGYSADYSKISSTSNKDGWGLGIGGNSDNAADYTAPDINGTSRTYTSSQLKNNVPQKTMSFYVGRTRGGGKGGVNRLLIEGGELSSVNGGGYQNNTVIGYHLRIRGGWIKGAVYGTASSSDTKANLKLVITGGEVNGWVAGGCNGTDQQNGNAGCNDGNTYIYVGGTTNLRSHKQNPDGTPIYNSAWGYVGSVEGGAIYGSGRGMDGSDSFDHMGSTVESYTVVADEAYVERNVCGGGYYGISQQGYIFITGGTIGGSVYGGAWGPVSNTNTWCGKNTYIDMSGGLVKGGIYGGNYGGTNAAAAIQENATVNIYGGQVGTDATHTANVHGGGFGSSTRVLGSVNVTVGKSGATDGATIYGDVYGGSAEGRTNGNTARTNDAVTNVTLNAGTINGNLYGGGLGTTGTDGHAADVYGPVQVTVNGGEVKNVFGCNNVKGRPQSTVGVQMTGGEVHECVYGGGNAAPYTGTPEVTVEGGEVHQHVFGGGLGSGAIITGSTHVTIQGTAHIHGNVYGGGNGGLVTGNTHVDIK